jgi:hypothetical protein
VLNSLSFYGKIYISILEGDFCMREGTSGVWVTRKGGKITIGYEDYGVSEFGGADFEKTYILDKENSKKLVRALRKCGFFGSLKRKIVKAFGPEFDDLEFWDFCDEHEIDYEESSWRS